MKTVSVLFICVALVAAQGADVVSGSGHEDLLIVGDSITYGFGVKCENCKYRNILARQFKSHGMNVTIHQFSRAGASVQTIDPFNFKNSFRQISKPTKKCRGVCSVTEMIKHLQIVPYTSTAAYRRLVDSKLKVDKAMVFIGMNDANSVMYRPEVFEKNYKHLFSLAKEKGDPKMFVATVQPICGQDFLGYYGGSANGYHQRGALSAINKHIRSLAKELNATLIDLEKTFDCKIKDPSPSEYDPLPFGTIGYYAQNTLGVADGELYRGWKNDNVHPDEFATSVMAKQMLRTISGRTNEIPSIDRKKGEHSIDDVDKCVCDHDDEWYLSKNAKAQGEEYWPDN